VNRLEEIVGKMNPKASSLNAECYLVARGYQIKYLEIAPELLAVVAAAKSLLSEDGAKEVVAHYVVLQILRDALAALDAKANS
jgi:hypothetical protein